MRSVKRIVILSAIIFLGLIVIFLSNEWNRAAFGSEGHIEKGAKFGLMVGASKKDITEYLIDQGLDDVSTLGANEVGYNPQSCHYYIYDDQFEVQVWHDKSWRSGVICVAFLDGELARVSWMYDMLAP